MSNLFLGWLQDAPIEEVIARYKETDNPLAVPAYEEVLFNRLSAYTLAMQTRVKDARMIKATDTEKLKRAKLEDNTDFYNSKGEK